MPITTSISIKDKPVNVSYQNVTGLNGTSEPGDGAKFDVVKTNGYYNVSLDSENLGTGYIPGNTVTIPGTTLGGLSPDNDLLLTVNTVGLQGKIATFSQAGLGRIGDGIIDILVDVTGTSAVDTYTFNDTKNKFNIIYNDGNLAITSTLSSVIEFSLHDVERLKFQDKHLAFDIDNGGTAGKIYAMMSAAVGKTDVTPAYIGAGLFLAETLGWTDKEIAAKILTSDEYKNDAGGVSNETFAKQVWKNTFGVQATAQQVAEIVETIEKYGYSQADVLLVAAKRPELLNDIDLVGIQSTGLEFIPFGG